MPINFDSGLAPGLPGGWYWPIFHGQQKIVNDVAAVGAATPPPDPIPWRRLPGAVAFLLSRVNTIEAAALMSDQKGGAAQIVAAASNAITQFLDSDDICPPWPYPGPPPWLIDIASELTFIANTVQEGSLRTAILKVAGQVLDRAQARTKPGASKP